MPTLQISEQLYQRLVTRSSEAGLSVEAWLEQQEQMERRESTLRASEAQFGALLESASGAIIVSNENGQILLVNHQTETMFGYERAELLGQSIEILIPSHLREKHTRQRTRFLEHPYIRPHNQVMGIVALHKDGTKFPVDIGLSFARTPDGLVAMSYITDISERLQAEQLRLNQERLQASLKKEKEFNAVVQRAVSALYHDMRMPLSVITLARDMLDRHFDRMDEEKRHEQLASIGKQLNYVMQLLNDVSLTVKGTLDQKIFQPVPVNLASLCQVSINEIQSTTGIKHRLVFTTDGKLHTVRVDETLISRILLNLLSNAIKFSPDGSEVRLDLRRFNDCIQMQVSDQGMGISEDDLPHIFKAFYRAGAAQDIAGTGLGLNIVKDCVERHRGKVGVKSQIGKGTTFTIELPLEEADVAAVG